MRDWIDEQTDVWKRELPELDPIAEQIFFRMYVIVRELRRRQQDSLAECGLTEWQFKTLKALRRRGDPYRAMPTELATQLDLSRAAMTKRLDSLERAGYIERVHDPADRRRLEVVLTRAGHRICERAVAKPAEVEAALLDPLTARQRDQLADLLRTLVRRLDA